jgi:hypothetical protein
MTDWMKKAPQHVIDQYGSTRAFKQAKRRNAKALQRAAHNMRIGCAFLPNYMRITRVIDEIDSIVKELSVEAIGR